MSKKLIKKFQKPAGTLGWTIPWYDLNSGWISKTVASTEENPLYTTPELDEMIDYKFFLQKLEKLEDDIQFKRYKYEDDLHLKHDTYIPYLEEKQIKLTHPDKNTKFKDRNVIISTNILDSIAKYANNAELPLKSALGLVGQESTFGYGRHFYQEDKPSVDLISNWSWSDWENPYTELFREAERRVGKSYGFYTKEENKLYYKYLLEGLKYADNQAKIRLENSKHPLQHGFELYKTGKYNPGDPNHTQMVEERGDRLIESPEIQKWMRESPYVSIEKQGGRLIPKHAKGNSVNTNPLPKMPINTNPIPKKEDKKKKKLIEVDQRTIGNIPPQYLTFPNVDGKGLYMIKK